LFQSIAILRLYGQKASRNTVCCNISRS
jgi:hypothetical protein